MSASIKVQLIDRTLKELGALHQKTGLSETDIVNRAISLYALYQDQVESGHELAFYSAKHDEFEVVRLS